MNFSAALRHGQAGESFISKWLISRGASILPVYEKIMDTGKGPQLFTISKSLVAPDLIVFPKDKPVLFVEAKRKSAFTWHRITNRWTTGIDLRHYNDYLEVQQTTGVPVWLMFLQEGGTAKGEDRESPSGLFGNSLENLSRTENHRSDKWGDGMVYWAYESLERFDSFDFPELEATS